MVFSHFKVLGSFQSWRAFFSEKAPTQGVTSSKPPQRKPKKRRSGDGGGGGPGGPFQPTGGPAGPTVKAPQADWKYIDDHLTVQAIIRAYQTRGHLAADLDPLGIVGPTGKKLSEDNPKIDATKAVLCQHYYYQFSKLSKEFISRSLQSSSSFILQMILMPCSNYPHRRESVGMNSFCHFSKLYLPCGILPNRFRLIAGRY